MKNLVLQLGALLTIVLIIGGCASTGSNVNNSNDEERVIDVFDPSLTLADYLRRAGGVSVQNVNGGTSIRIRGNLSFNSNSDPLFILDGVRLGNDYDRVKSLVPLDFIESIQVLKGSEASSRFGLTASSGAIIITTKKG